MCQTKKCKKCGEDKPLDTYYKDKRKKDGVRSQCKVCTHNYYRGYYESGYNKINQKKRLTVCKTLTDSYIVERLKKKFPDIHTFSPDVINLHRNIISLRRLRLNLQRENYGIPPGERLENSSEYTAMRYKNKKNKLFIERLHLHDSYIIRLIKRKYPDASPTAEEIELRRQQILIKRNKIKEKWNNQKHKTG